MEKLLSILTNHGQISGVLADTANRQYRLISSKSDSFENYNRKNTRVDVFWRDLLNGENIELFTIIKVVCCLSHGISAVERGFSINAECLFDNMRDESVVARRIVYDAIAAKGGLEHVLVSKSLILKAKNAHSLYVEDMKRRRNEEADGRAELSVKRQREAEARVLQAKKAKILEDAQREAAKLEAEIKILKK